MCDDDVDDVDDLVCIVKAAETSNVYRGNLFRWLVLDLLCSVRFSQQYV